MAVHFAALGHCTHTLRKTSVRMQILKDIPLSFACEAEGRRQSLLMGL